MKKFKEWLNEIYQSFGGSQVVNLASAEHEKGDSGRGGFGQRGKSWNLTLKPDGVYAVWATNTSDGYISGRAEVLADDLSSDDALKYVAQHFGRDALKKAQELIDYKQ